ncbi:MAG TPA: hypothetical protein VIH28_12140 [Ignavibacteriaceae bacterium]
MLLEKKWIGSIAAILMFGLFLMNGCSEKKSEEKTAEDMTEQLSNENTEVGSIDIGLPMYPGAEQDPEQPPINTPHMKNIKILTSDSFDEVVAWYSKELGEFDIDHQEKGYQALWSKKTDDGIFQAATITTIFAPAGKVAIILVKGKTGR